MFHAQNRLEAETQEFAHGGIRPNRKRMNPGCTPVVRPKLTGYPGAFYFHLGQRRADNILAQQLACNTVSLVLVLTRQRKCSGQKAREIPP